MPLRGAAARLTTDDRSRCNEAEFVMKSSEVRKMSDAELRVEPDRLRRRLYDLRSQQVTEKLENPRQLRNIRRDIARLLTEIRRRQTQETS
ncbi:MAG: 50S ribosomal protein L29 [Phycisphaeraceae bacterium]|nr:50S ribosomal protein L29 [Phycisphaeraceae bacterium]